MKITIPQFIVNFFSKKTEEAIKRYSKGKSKKFKKLLNKALKDKKLYKAENITGFIQALVAVTVVLSVGLVVTSKVGEQLSASNSTAAVGNAISTIPNTIGVFITVAVAMLVIGFATRLATYK